MRFIIILLISLFTVFQLLYANAATSDTSVTIKKLYYPDGTLKQINQYKNGKKSGYERKYSHSNTLDIEAQYKNGKKEGSYRVYDENGRLWGEFFFKNDKVLYGYALKKDGSKIKLNETIFHKLGFKY